MDDLTVFYAWQSDLPPKTNRYLIRGAVKKAIKAVVASGEIDDSPRLDSDTQEVAGTPAIATTIFDKIAKCGVFLCDLSFVGCSNNNDQLPNPNVLLELGYAASKVGWERIVWVMNTAYGSPEKLPFDIRHRRWPITFTLVKNAREAMRRKQSNALTTDLVCALKAALQSEHQLTLDVVGRLDVHCLKWMHSRGKRDSFPSPVRNTMGKALIHHLFDAALPRMLDLGLLRCDVSGDGKVYAYHWTYLGKMLLKKFGIRQ